MNTRPNPLSAATLLALALCLAVVAAGLRMSPTSGLYQLSLALGHGLAAGGIFGLAVMAAPLVLPLRNGPTGAVVFRRSYGRVDRPRFWLTAFVAYGVGWLLIVLAWIAIDPGLAFTPFEYNLVSAAPRTTWVGLGVVFAGQLPAAALAHWLVDTAIVRPLERDATPSWRAWSLIFIGPFAAWFTAETIGVVYDFGFLNPDGSSPLFVFRDSLFYTANQIPNSFALVAERGYAPRGLALYAVLLVPAWVALQAMAERSATCLLGDAPLNALAPRPRAVVLGALGLVLSCLLGVAGVATGQLW
ncbi:MAG: hypothetical protein HQ495_01050 [Alphaproteobacteria bacterium]|nr:hypothetical protein [Alphaproteobacteria bacterium]